MQNIVQHSITPPLFCRETRTWKTLTAEYILTVVYTSTSPRLTTLQREHFVPRISEYQDHLNVFKILNFIYYKNMKSVFLRMIKNYFMILFGNKT